MSALPTELSSLEAALSKAASSWLSISASAILVLTSVVSSVGHARSSWGFVAPLSLFLKGFLIVYGRGVRHSRAVRCVDLFGCIDIDNLSELMLACLNIVLCEAARVSAKNSMCPAMLGKP